MFKPFLNCLLWELHTIKSIALGAVFAQQSEIDCSLCLAASVCPPIWLQHCWQLTKEIHFIPRIITSPFPWDATFNAHKIVWHLDNAAAAYSGEGGCFECHKPQIIMYVNKFYGMPRTLNLPLFKRIFPPSCWHSSVSSRALNSFHMHSKAPDKDRQSSCLAPPCPHCRWERFWFGICKYGHVCYYSK